MKSIFDQSARQEIITRINSLSSQNKAQWGKMNVYQMIKHCILEEDMVHGKLNIKRIFIGRLIGKMILKKELKPGKPFSKNSPTSPLLKVNEASGDIEKAKQEWIKSIEAYADFKNWEFVHPFFGRMSKEELGVFVYKHADHHLRQFGA